MERIINILALKDGANAAELERLLIDEYAPFWRKIPGCLKVEILENNRIQKSGPFKSKKLYVTTELWDSQESLSKVMRLAAEEPQSDAVKQGMNILKRWSQYADQTYLHTTILYEEE